MTARPRPPTGPSVGSGSASVETRPGTYGVPQTVTKGRPAMTTALVARGVPDPTAHLAGKLGVLAFKRGYAEWSQGDRDAEDELAQYTLAALDELRAASASLG